MNCPGHCVMFANRARSYRWAQGRGGLGRGAGGAPAACRGPPSRLRL
jgi:hypothetical protein